MPEQEGTRGEGVGDGGPGEKGGPSPDAAGRWRLILWLILATALFFWVRSVFGPGEAEGPRIPYTDFRAKVEAGEVLRVTVRGDRIRGTLRSTAVRTTAEQDTVRYTEFVTFLPSFGDDELYPLLESRGVEVRTLPEGDFSWWPVLLSVLPFLFLLILGFFFVRRMRSQGQNLFSIGESKATLYERRDEETTFGDVAGCEGPKRELQEIIAFLREPERFESLGGEIPKGVLLVGPPGTGKTLLARAVAGEADVPFFIVTGSDFMEMFVGVGAKRVRDLFDSAKEAAPSIIFIDELDSIGRQRGAGLGGGHDEREQTLNQLLSELDGFEPAEGVIVMGATNRPDILDPALLRPGRFDRRITVPLPTAGEREEILKIHAREKPLAEDVDLERLSRGTPGLSGADLKNVLNEAALLAARKERKRIQPNDIDEARDKVLMGLEREGIALTDEELELLAYHESGHALVAALLEHTDPVHKVTIVPRGRAMGVTQQLPEEDRYIYRKEYMEDRMAVMMGGRAAEDLVFGTASSGAEDDLRQATKLARKMVLDWGMGERLGKMVSERDGGQVFLGEEIAQRREYSEETQREVDEEVRAMVDGAHGRARDLLEERRASLDEVADLLREREELSGEEVAEIVAGGEGAQDGATP